MSYNAYQYAIAAGFDVPLVSLNNVQALLFPHNRVTSKDAPVPVVITSDPVDFAPVRLQTLDAQESRDGITYQAWDMVLTTGGISFWLNYLWSGAVASVTGDISAAVTIYTRLAELNSYTRQNAYAIYPTRRSAAAPNGDLVYSHQRGRFLLHQRFTDLVPSA